MIVELKYAPLPYSWGLAVHHWFVVTHDTGRQVRWEIWQHKDSGGTSVGHLHQNLMHPDSGVGRGGVRREQIWINGPAAQLADTLVLSWRTYPHRDRYHYWPGPNSNTYVAWVLRQAGLTHKLSWKGFGKHFESAVVRRPGF